MAADHLEMAKQHLDIIKLCDRYKTLATRYIFFPDDLGYHRVCLQKKQCWCQFLPVSYKNILFHDSIRFLKEKTEPKAISALQMPSQSSKVATYF